MLFETLIHLVHVVHIPVAAITCTEFIIHLRHIQNSLDMVYFKKSHRLTCLTVSNVYSFFFRKDFQEGVQRSETTKIDGRSGPVHNYTRNLLHNFIY